MYEYKKKMSTYYQRNREKLLSPAKEYYEIIKKNSNENLEDIDLWRICVWR